MKSVCHITSVHPINDVRIFHKECKSLAAAGFNVTLIACGDHYLETYNEGVKQIVLNIPVKNRVERMISRSNAIYIKALELDADIYHFHDPELLNIGLKLKHKGKKVIYDSHENTTVLIKTRKWIPKIFRRVLSFFFEKYEKRIVKNFDAIITVTPQIVEKFKEINDKTYLITNYPTINISKVNDKKSNYLCFAGGLTNSYMFENVLDALSDINDFEFKFLIAGAPSYKGYLDILKSKKGWKKVEYLGRLTPKEVEGIYHKSLVGIAILDYTANVGFKEGSLGVLKFFEYLNAGLPVICTDFRLWENIIDKYKCGICVNPHNIEEIRNAILFMLNNPELAKQMGLNGKRAIKEEYNWGFEEIKLIKIYNELI